MPALEEFVSHRRREWQRLIRLYPLAASLSAQLQSKEPPIASCADCRVRNPERAREG